MVTEVIGKLRFVRWWQYSYCITLIKAISRTGSLFEEKKIKEKKKCCLHSFFRNGYIRWDFCDYTSRVSFIGCTSNDVFPLTGLRYRYVLTAEMVRSTFIARGHQIPIRLGRSQLGQSHMETWGVFSECQRGQFSIRNRTKCIDSNTSERRNTLYSQVSNCTYVLWKYMVVFSVSSSVFINVLVHVKASNYCA